MTSKSRHNLSSYWVIVASSSMDGEEWLYWSDSAAWTDRENATHYTDKEHVTTEVPEGGEWTEVTEGRKKKATYYGHKSKPYWSVALWLFNEENLYRLVVQECKRAKTKDQAARNILACLPAKTPDGHSYTFGAVRSAIKGEM